MTFDTKNNTNTPLKKILPMKMSYGVILYNVDNLNRMARFKMGLGTQISFTRIVCNIKTRKCREVTSHLLQELTEFCIAFSVLLRKTAHYKLFQRISYFLAQTPSLLSVLPAM